LTTLPIYLPIFASLQIRLKNYFGGKLYKKHFNQFSYFRIALSNIYMGIKQLIENNIRTIVMEKWENI